MVSPPSSFSSPESSLSASVAAEGGGSVFGLGTLLWGLERRRGGALALGRDDGRKMGDAVAWMAGEGRREGGASGEEVRRRLFMKCR